MSLRTTILGPASVGIILLNSGPGMAAAADALRPLSLGEAVQHAVEDAAPVTIARANLDASQARRRESP